MRAILIVIFIFGFFTLNVSCEKDEEIKTQITIEAKNATNVTADGFQANWEIIENVEGYELQVSKSSDYRSDIEKFIVNGADNNYQIVEGLDVYCKYYFRVRYIKSVGDTSDYSNSVFVTTNLYLNDFNFMTTDRIMIAATIKKKINLSGDVSAVIFIHEGMSSKEEWINNDMFNKMVDQGCIALAFDIRGHGDSDGDLDIASLTSDPNQMPLDLDAAINYLKDIDDVNVTKIGIIGGSLGACLATGATKQYEEVKVAVALTAVKYIVTNLFGTSGFHHVYYISGENDIYGPDASSLYSFTESPKKIDVVVGSSNHGVALINSSPELFNSAYNWLIEYL